MLFNFLPPLPVWASEPCNPIRNVLMDLVETPPMNTLKATAIQYPIDGNKTLNEFISKSERLVNEAADQGSQLVMFPELAVLDMLSTTSGVPDARQLEEIARTGTPVYFERMAELSRRRQVSVLAGSMPRETPDGIVNTALLAFPNGRRVYQDKIFLTPDEVEWGWKPGSELKVFNAPWGKSVITICYDCQFSLLSNELSKFPLELIFVPSMTGEKGFSRVRWAAQARSVEHYSYVMVTGTVNGPGVTYNGGQAAFITPQDSGFPGILMEGPKDQSGSVTATFDMAKLRQRQESTGLYSARDARRRRTPIRVIEEP